MEEQVLEEHNVVGRTNAKVMKQIVDSVEKKG